MRTFFPSTIAAILVLSSLSMIHRSFGADASPSTVPADNTPAVSQSPQVLQIARWDVLLNDSGLDTVKQASPQPAQTKSKVYQAMKFDAAALRAAIAQAKVTKGVFAFSAMMVFSQNQGMGRFWMQPLNFVNYNFGADVVVGLQGGISGNETDDAPDADHVHFKFDYPDFHLQVFQRSNRGFYSKEGPPASIQFDGSLAASEAIAFVGDYNSDAGIVHHMIAWEVMKTPENRANFFQMMGDPETWCDNGPEGLNNMLDIADVWAAGATHEPSQVKPQFEQKTEDGKTVRLQGLTRPDKWPFCWWDGEGKPVSLQNQFQLGRYALQNPLWCYVAVSGDKNEWKLHTPTGHLGAFGNFGQNSGDYSAMQDMQSQDMKSLKVGVPVGPWIKVGDIAKGDSIDVDGVNYQLREIQQNGDNSFYCQFNPSQYNPNPTWTVTLSAEAQDGSQLDSPFMQQIFGANFGISYPQFQGMSLDKLKTLHVWKRKIQWLTFDNLLAEPPTPPKTDVTPAEVATAQAAALQRQQDVLQRQMQAQFDAQGAQRKQWEAIPPDPSNPKGALRALCEAAKKDDVKAVRQRLRGNNDDENKYLDLYASMITDRIFIRSTLVARFGEGKINSLPLSDPLFAPDLEPTFSSNWQTQPDGSLTRGSLTVSKGSDGQYQLSVKISAPKGSSFDAQFKPFLARLEQIKKLLADNPTMTFDQLEKAAQNLPK